ncbi:MAG: hypothetical protein HC872_04815 [Gammaproteobacteria bacterium]|nr:hypothetical protein [Gammaproteobacteria bacterium]
MAADPVGARDSPVARAVAGGLLLYRECELLDSRIVGASAKQQMPKRSAQVAHGLIGRTEAIDAVECFRRSRLKGCGITRLQRRVRLLEPFEDLRRIGHGTASFLPH